MASEDHMRRAIGLSEAMMRANGAGRSAPSWSRTAR